jgi:hypothetical protein
LGLFFIGLQLAHFQQFISFLNFWFFRIWLFFLLLIVIAGWALGCKRARSEFRLLEVASVQITGASGPPRRCSDYLYLAVFSLFTVVYVFMILYREDFACYDCDVLMDYAAVGRRFPPPIWTGAGRFFPLAFQEFHALQFFTRSPTGFHLFAVAELLVLLFFSSTLSARLECATSCLVPHCCHACPQLRHPLHISCCS